MSRLGNLLHFGQLFKAYGTTIILPKSPKYLGNFCEGVKICHFSNEIVFGQLLLTFGNFLLVTLFFKSCCWCCLRSRVSAKVKTVLSGNRISPSLFLFGKYGFKKCVWAIFLFSSLSILNCILNRCTSPSSSFH